MSEDPIDKPSRNLIKEWVDLNVDRLTAFGIVTTLATFILSQQSSSRLAYLLGITLMILANILWFTMDKIHVRQAFQGTDEDGQNVYMIFRLVMFILNFALVVFSISIVPVEFVQFTTTMTFMILLGLFVSKAVKRINGKKHPLLTWAWALLALIATAWYFYDVFTGYGIMRGFILYIKG